MAGRSRTGALQPLAVVVPLKLAIDVAVLSLVNRAVTENYMDEPFHVPQTQQYCDGRWRSWDPKITTLPGLYVVSVAWARLLEAGAAAFGSGQCLAKVGGGCSTQALRALNVVLAAACVPVLHAILASRQRRQHPPSCRHPDSLLWLWALTLSAMPLHWFFTFMFYTDVGSALLLLTCHLLAVEQRRVWAAAVAGAAAVLFRQTNAVWVGFVTGALVLELTGVSGPGQGVGWVGEVRVALAGVRRAPAALLARLAPLLAVLAAFGAFLVANGGVTVGDRAAHTPVRHPAQLIYFTLFSAGLLWPAAASELVSATVPTLKMPRRAVQLAIAFALAAGVSAAALLSMPPPHPYLLADNRHYTFYLWRRLLGRGRAVRLAVISPAAGLAAVLLLRMLCRAQARLWVLGFGLCLAAVLVPAWLLEFRYFTVGFLLLALHIPVPRAWQAALMLLTFTAINALTMRLYLTRTWAWADGSTARFMW